MHDIDFKSGQHVQQVVLEVSSSLMAGEWDCLELGLATTEDVIGSTYDYLMKVSQLQLGGVPLMSLVGTENADFDLSDSESSDYINDVELKHSTVLNYHGFTVGDATQVALADSQSKVAAVP